MRASSKTTNKPEPDALPSMVDPREAMTVSCDHPADLAARLRAKEDAKTKRCAWCGLSCPVEDFDGYLTCGGCRERR